MNFIMQKKLFIQSKTDNSKNESGIRLNKYLSDSGICSRREADRLIADGKVYVNGKKAEMGMRITSNDKVECNGKIASLEEDMVLLAFNKPAGIECTTDRSNPDNIIDYIKYPKKIFYVGRLDKNSTGLILMTNDEKYTMPDITGWSRMDAISLCDMLKIKYNVEGYGYVESQSLGAGSEITDNSSINITLKEKYDIQVNKEN